MIHCAGAAVVLVLALALPALVAAAGVPAGPRLTLVIDRAKTLTNELVALGPNGEAVQRLDKGGIGSGNEFGERPNWNTAGSQMAFTGPGHETTDVFLINGDDKIPRLTRFLGLLSAAGVVPTRIETREPSLDEVFLALAGRTIAQVEAE